MNHDTTPELIISAAASKSTWAGVVSMFFGWLVSSNAAIVVGMLVGVAGGGVGIDKEARLDFEKRMEKFPVNLLFRLAAMT